jgi:hypothetical protein
MKKHLEHAHEVNVKQYMLKITPFAIDLAKQ